MATHFSPKMITRGSVDFHGNHRRQLIFTGGGGLPPPPPQMPHPPPACYEGLRPSNSTNSYMVRRERQLGPSQYPHNDASSLVALGKKSRAYRHEFFRSIENHTSRLCLPVKLAFCCKPTYSVSCEIEWFVISGSELSWGGFELAETH